MIKIHPANQTPDSSIEEMLKGMFTDAEVIKFSIAFITAEGYETINSLFDFSKMDYQESFGVTSINYPTDIKTIEKISSKTGNRLYIHTGYRNYIVDKGFRPLMHTKILLTEDSKGIAKIYIGSHNWTGNAIKGFNLESGIYIECSKDEFLYTNVINQLNYCKEKSELFDPEKINLYKLIQRRLYERIHDINIPKVDFDLSFSTIIHCELEGLKSLSLNDSLYIEYEDELSDHFITDRRVYLYCYPDGELFRKVHPSIERSAFLFEAKVTSSNRTEFHPTNPDEFRLLEGPKFMLVDFKKPKIRLRDNMDSRNPHCQGVIKLERKLDELFIFHEGNNRPSFKTDDEIEFLPSIHKDLSTIYKQPVLYEKIISIKLKMELKIPYIELYKEFIGTIKTSIDKEKKKDDIGEIKKVIKFIETDSKFIYASKYQLSLHQFREIFRECDLE